MVSPFTYGGTVSNSSFTNREQEIKKLTSNLLSGIHTTIISPRRWGKSSLVEKVVNTINSTNNAQKAVIIDLFSVSCFEEFLELYAREIIKASSTKWQDWVNQGKTFFKQLIPQLSIGIDPQTDFSISFDWKELIKHQDEILNLPEHLAKKQNIRLIVCLDEFQNVATFTGYENFEKKMRSAWQRHKNVTYCLYGSKRHMMANIFNNATKPFYRFGDILLLEKIETEKWIHFICGGFKQTNKEISTEIAGSIAALMKNHPWYVQQLAHYTWNKTTKQCTQDEVNSALNELIQSNAPLYQREVEELSLTQLNLVKAIIKGESKLTSAQVMQDYKLGTPHNVSKNKKYLLHVDMVHALSNGQFEMLDPAFEIWFKRVYFNFK